MKLFKDAIVDEYIKYILITWLLLWEHSFYISELEDKVALSMFSSWNLNKNAAWNLSNLKC